MIVAIANEASVEVDEDLALVRLAQGGDLAAFERLMHKYERIVLAVVQSIIGNREEAQNAAVEAFFLAYQKLSCIAEGTKFATWLMRMAVRESLSRLAVQSAAADQFLEASEARNGETLSSEPVDWVMSPSNLYDPRELRELLSNTLRSVPPTARLVFVLRDIGGFSLPETAEILGLSRTTVREHLCQTRLQLRERLATHFNKPMRDADLWISVGTPVHGPFSNPDCLSQD